MKYYTSDLHLGDYRVIPDSPKNYRRRPLFNSVEEHDRAIIYNLLNAGIKSNDTLYIAGDCVFSNDSIPLLSLLPNCKRVLILGNHDVGRVDKLAPYFDEVWGNLIIDFKFGRLGIAHYPTDVIQMIEEGECDYGICGHVHDAWRMQRKIYNVGVDNWGFKPISHEKLEAEFESLINFYMKDSNCFPYKNFEIDNVDNV